jgi:phosphoglycerol transferase MdoB-like AlkP superfamily enzyme
MEFLLTVFYLVILKTYLIIKNTPSIEYLIKKEIYDLYSTPYLRLQVFLFIFVIFILFKLFKKIKKKLYTRFIFSFSMIIITLYYFLSDLFNIKLNQEMIIYTIENFSILSAELNILLKGDYLIILLFFLVIFLYTIYLKIINNNKLYLIANFIFNLMLINIIILIVLSYFIDFHKLLSLEAKSSFDTDKNFLNQKVLIDQSWFNVKLNPVKHHFKKEWGFSLKKNKNLNVVIFLLESVRYDAINLETSKFFNPNLKSNIFIPYFFVPIPHSSNTHFTLLTGFYSPQKIHRYYTKIYQESFFKELETKNLIYELKKNYYKTYYITTNDTTFENEYKFFKLLNLELIDKKELSKYSLSEFEWGIDDYALFLKTKELFSELNPPFFVLYVFSNSHTPYFISKNPNLNIFNENKYSINQTRKERYLNSIKYTLNVVDLIMEIYKSHPNYDDTIFILLSDHGESFGERGFILHDFSLYNEEIRIPFVMHNKNFIYLYGKEKFKYGTLLDVVPTIYDLLQLEINYPLPGRSLFTPEYHLDLLIYPWGDNNKKGIIKNTSKWILFFDSYQLEHISLDDELISKSLLDKNFLYLKNWEPFDDLRKNILR